MIDKCPWCLSSLVLFKVSLVPKEVPCCLISFLDALGICWVLGVLAYELVEFLE